MERNYYYQQLTFMYMNMKDEDIKARIGYALKTHDGNELYLRDVYKEVIKGAKKCKTVDRNYLVIENMIKRTSSPFNPWYIADKEELNWIMSK